MKNITTLHDCEAVNAMKVIAILADPVKLFFFATKEFLHFLLLS
jgi:hypothetical protein